MEHSEIEDKDIIDKYLLHQLSEGDENNFEEHLLFCNECQSTLESRKVTIGLIRVNQLNSYENDLIIVKKTNKQKSTIYLTLKIAAAVVILFTITFIINILIDKSVAGKKISFNTFINDSIINKKSSTFDKNSQFSDKTNQVAEAYIKMPEFENFIKNNSIRAENITVLSPKSTEKVDPNELILINWVLQNTDSLNFIVFDNKAKIVFEEKIAPSYKYLQKLKPGLYYWQLETSEEALFTGKFIVEY